MPDVEAPAPGLNGKRRAASLSERLPLASQGARSAVASAFASTSQRLARLKLRSASDNLLKPPPAVSSAWRSFRSRHGVGSGSSSSAFRWAEGDALPHARARFDFHGEDAGDARAWLHVVADGVSAPFARASLAREETEPESSARIAREVVKCVVKALEDVTNGGRAPIDAPALEQAALEGVRSARIACFPFRQSRLATTLAVAYFDRWNGRLLTFSLGDSKTVVVRAGRVVFETPDVLREFNVPCVVNLATQVASQEYAVHSFALQEGDVCLTFSDGVADNLYKDDIARVIASADRFGDRPAADGSPLQQVADLLVDMSRMHSPKAKARKRKGVQAASTPVHPLGDAEDFVSPKLLLLQPEMAEDDAQGALFPFATAAAAEYRARALEECKGGATEEDREHLAASLALFERHKGKQTLDRHVVVRKASRKRHYSLAQLRRMAEMQTKKPDDITLFMTRFVRQASDK